MDTPSADGLPPPRAGTTLAPTRVKPVRSGGDFHSHGGDVVAKTILGKIEGAVADAAKAVGHTVTEGVDWVKEKAGLGPKPEVDPASIRPQMDVMSSCGCKMGSVEQVEGGAVKLGLRDSPDGLYHYVPVGWVANVDDRVHLTTNKAATREGWKPSAKDCAAAD